MTNWDLIKTLYPFMKPFKWQIILALAILPLSSATYSIQPILLQKAIDGPIAAFDLAGLWTYALFLLGAVAINFVLQVVQFFIMNKVGQAMVADIRYSLFEHLESMSMSFFDRNPVGKSVSRVTSDMEQLAESFVGGLVLILLDIFNILGILLFMFYLNWRLSLVVSVFLIPIYFITIYYQELYRKANLMARKELAKLNSFLQQNIVGISVVQVLNSTAKSMNKFAEYNRQYFKANDQSIKADAQLSATIEMVSLFAIIALIYISSKIFAASVLTIGMILAFIQYSQALFEPIRNLSDRFTVIQSAFTAIERMRELLDEPIGIKDRYGEEKRSDDAATQCIDNDSQLDGGALRARNDDKLIKFNHVCFQYQDKTPVLNDVSFEVEQGQKIAIIGKTGSGKSTVIKLLTRLYELDQGSIEINGRNIKEIPQLELREKIAVIHQDTYIFAGNLESNIKLGRDEAKLDMQLAKRFLDLAPGLRKERDLLNLSNVSSGEEQVINFARALVARPDILVLDEATAKIDLETEKAIYELLNEYIQGKTLITIAHRLETIKSADLVLELKNGSLLKQ
ncbi:MAG: ABC transporter ATP-binding protein [Candidatus Melainabacteria bacterium]|jgi:ATP-binding cassette, subfamily B, multidrug efflux pump|nr:ABC transporter ATP-binding protein [Candidatus Melainabacteria bacterium]